MCNGASPLVLDNARHNSALHWAASCCRADCVGRLLGSGAIFQMQSGQQVAIAGGLAVLGRFQVWGITFKPVVPLSYLFGKPDSTFGTAGVLTQPYNILYIVCWPRLY